MDTISEQYKPGDCNIGSVEIARRRTMGWICAVATIVLGMIFIIFHTSPPWRLLLFFPATLSASGFIQAYTRFCSGLGMKGVFNFGNQLYKTTSVERKEFKTADRKRALQLIGYSVVMGLIVVVIACFI